MLKKKNEARITTEWLKRWKEKPNAWLYKIPDDSIAKKPFDVVWCINGKWVAIEFKYCDTKKVPDIKRAFKKLEPHQVVNLNNYKVAWGDAFIIVYHNESKKYITFSRDEVVTDLCEDINRIFTMIEISKSKK